MLQNRFIKDFFSYGLIGVISKFISFFILPIYASHLSPADFGIIEITTLLISVLSMFGSLQLESSLLRLYFDKNSEIQKKCLFSTGLYFNIIFSLILMTVLLIVSYILYDMNIKFKEISLLIIIFTLLQLPFINIFGYNSVLLRSKFDKKKYLVLNFSQIILNIMLGLIVVVYLNLGIEGLIISNFITILVFSFVSINFVKQSIIKTFNIEILKDMLCFSIPLIPSSSMLYLQQFLSRIFIFSTFTLTELGLYSIAGKFASPLLMIAATVKISWTPLVYDNFNNKQKKDFDLLLQKFLLFGLVLIFFIHIFSKELILFLFDENYTTAYTLISLIAFSYYLKGIQNMVSPGLGVVKKSFLLSISVFIGVSVSLLFMYLLAQDIGLIGVIYGAVFGEMTSLIILLGFINKYFINYFNIKSIVLFIIIAIIIINITLLQEIDLLYKILISLSIGIFFLKRLRN